MFKIVIFTSDRAVFAERKAELIALTVPAANILWCDSLKQSRGEFIVQYVGEWLLFLDHDCFVTAASLKRTADLIRGQISAGNVVFSGRYQNSEGAGYLQRAHNFIANTWLEQSFAIGSQNLILGGVFLIHCLREPVFTQTGRFWGAEDKMLSYELSRQGFSVSFSETLYVRHETTGTLSHFLKRAFLHGKHEVKYFRFSTGNKINYRFWIQKIGFANASLLPLILLHFCIQRAGLWFQKARRMNTQQT